MGQNALKIKWRVQPDATCTTAVQLKMFSAEYGDDIYYTSCCCLGIQIFLCQAIIQPFLPCLWQGGRLPRCGCPLEVQLDRDKAAEVLDLLKVQYNNSEDWRGDAMPPAPVGTEYMTRPAKCPPYAD